MSFWDSVGDAIGRKMAEYNDILEYKSQYEAFDNDYLIREYKELKNQSGQEMKNRKSAVQMILQERGLGN